MEGKHLAVKVVLVDADTMLENWPYYELRIRDAMTRSLRAEDSLDAVCEKLADYEAHLLEITVAGEPRAVAVMDVLHRKDGEALNVWGISGEQMDTWLGDFVVYLKEQAERLQMDWLTCGGRTGWERALKRHGWAKNAVIMEHRICH